MNDIDGISARRKKRGRSHTRARHQFNSSIEDLYAKPRFGFDEPVKPKSKKAAKVSINIDIDTAVVKNRFKKAVRKVRAFPRVFKAWPRQKWLGVAAMVLLIFPFVAVSLAPKVNKSKDSGAQVLSDAAKKAPFDLVIPGKNIQDSSVAYDETKRVATFKGNIDGDQLIISQQQLPEEFKSSPADKVKELADKIYAKEVIEAGGLKAYLGTNAKGPQTLVFTTKNLLIFVNSGQKLTKETWTSVLLAFSVK